MLLRYIMTSVLNVVVSRSVAIKSGKEFLLMMPRGRQELANATEEQVRERILHVICVCCIVGGEGERLSILYARRHACAGKPSTGSLRFGAGWHSLLTKQFSR